MNPTLDLASTRSSKATRSSRSSKKRWRTLQDALESGSHSPTAMDEDVPPISHQRASPALSISSLSDDEPSAQKATQSVKRKAPPDYRALRRRRPDIPDIWNPLKEVIVNAFSDSFRIAMAGKLKLSEKARPNYELERSALWPMPLQSLPRPPLYAEDVEVDEDSEDSLEDNEGSTILDRDDDPTSGVPIRSVYRHHEALSAELSAMTNEIWFSEWAADNDNAATKPPVLDADIRECLVEETETKLKDIGYHMDDLYTSDEKTQNAANLPDLSWDSVLNAALLANLPPNVLRNARGRLERLFGNGSIHGFRERMAPNICEKAIENLPLAMNPMQSFARDADVLDRMDDLFDPQEIWVGKEAGSASTRKAEDNSRVLSEAIIVYSDSSANEAEEDPEEDPEVIVVDSGDVSE